MIVIDRLWEKPPEPAVIETHKLLERNAVMIIVSFPDTSEARFIVDTPSFLDTRSGRQHLVSQLVYKSTKAIRDGTARGERHWESFLQAEIDWARTFLRSKISLRSAS